MKTVSSKTTSSSASGRRDVPQLGEQAKQSISPLKVVPSHQGFTAADFAREAGLSFSQLLSEDIPMADVAWKYQKGQALVRPEKILLLPTQM